MKILLTGSNGFIGKNLSLRLSETKHEVLPFDIDTPKEKLSELVSQANFIVHLAGVNRPMEEKEFEDGNVFFTKTLLEDVQKAGSKAPILFASSTQAALDNPYGRSKKKAEELLFEFGKANGNPLFVCRFYNVFGKWCRPNYNSVIATFCYNVAHDLPLQVNPDAPAIDFIYIDDLATWILNAVSGKVSPSLDVLYPEPHFTKRLPEIVDLLQGFRASRDTHFVPEIADSFAKDLYSTYLSYLDEADFSYALDMHKDFRGSFTEALKTEGLGQVSVNISKPGIIKGNHYHHSKNEKYLVVKGTCEIKFRKLGTDKVITYRCSDKELRIVDIPPGYTHNITNVGKEDSVTLMWANELYDPQNPDTVYCPVEEEA